MRKLNLGAGKYIKKGYVNLDCIKLPGVDVVHDLNKYPYPFNDNEFDIVRCVHVLEHLDDIVKPMDEIWRLCKKKGRVIIEVPSFPGLGAVVDPTHKQFYTYGTFDYFTPQSQFGYYSKAKFIITRRKITFVYALFPLNVLSAFLNIVVNKLPVFQRVYFYNFSWVFPSSTIYIELEVVK